MLTHCLSPAVAHAAARTARDRVLKDGHIGTFGKVTLIMARALTNAGLYHDAKEALESLMRAEQKMGIFEDAANLYADLLRKQVGFFTWTVIRTQGVALFLSRMRRSPFNGMGQRNKFILERSAYR